MSTQQRLEAQSAFERESIQDTLGEIRRRLTPGQLVDEVLAYTKDGGSEFLGNFGRQATANPIPVTLIGAGLAWFLMSKGASASDTDRVDTAKAGASGLSDAVGHATGKIQDLAQTARDGVEAATDRLSSAAHSAQDGLESTVAQASAQTKAAIREAQSTMDRSLAFMKEQPLVLLGAGLAIGAAVGAGIPETKLEQDWMGEASADLKETVREQASDKFEQVKAAGAEFFSDAVAKSDDNFPRSANGASSDASQRPQ